MVMKLCMSCLEELFDRDVICPKCNSNMLICNDEIQQIQLKLKSSTKREKDKLLLDTKYRCINDYMINKQKRDESYPQIIQSDSDFKIINPSYNKAYPLQQTKPTVTCPYCQSTNTKKISGLSKAGSVALWGIFALGKTTKQWHCNECGSDF